MVLHYTAMEGAEALGRLCDPAAEVSTHWMIERDGTVHAMVEEAQRAWHAGEGEWAGCRDVNSASIGVELVNLGDEPFPEPQMAALEHLLGGILARWTIPPEGVIAHADMAPWRKRDPGPRFDWRRLAEGGLSVWPDAGDAGADLGDSLTAFGYPAAAPDLRLQAFRLRFRPWARGPEAPADRAAAESLARHWPAGAPSRVA